MNDQVDPEKLKKMLESQQRGLRAPQQQIQKPFIEALRDNKQNLEKKLTASNRMLELYDKSAEVREFVGLTQVNFMG